VFYNTSITSIAGWRILELPVLPRCVLQYKYYQYCWMKNTRFSSIVCFTILVLPVLLDEEYWSFQYRVFYNTSITSIVGWRILELPVLCIDQRFWYSSIVNARYWYIQYCIYTILDFRYCNITILVFLVLYSVTNTGISSIVNIIILVIPVFVTAASYYPLFFADKIIELRSIINMAFIQKRPCGGYYSFLDSSSSHMEFSALQ
jgi:hypothetical protein